ncbi:MAG: hypothetical protein DRR19_11140 [Candidatus Parabeggiatoa sp. nov. 1]|nr:MAG: hypothetical protein DRR19_11140 [Gammaproteobacteria bacterium]
MTQFGVFDRVSFARNENEGRGLWMDSKLLSPTTKIGDGCLSIKERVGVIKIVFAPKVFARKNFRREL